MTNFVDKTIETPGGRFSYAETGSGPVRLLLHSLLTDRTAFDDVADSLGGRIIALDLPGFGSSDTAAPEIDDYALRVAAFVTAMDLDNDLTVIGNGLGAFVGLGTAIHHGELLGKLLLVGCGAGFPEEAKRGLTGMIQAAETGGMDAVAPIALRRIFTEDFIAANPAIAEERTRIMLRTDPAAFITACSALRSVDYFGLASGVTVPTSIVVGDEDQATPPELAEQLHKLIPGSQLTRMPAIAHAPQLQDPEGFIKATEIFLEGR